MPKRESYLNKRAVTWCGGNKTQITHHRTAGTGVGMDGMSWQIAKKNGCKTR
jgi:hypothetical protein